MENHIISNSTYSWWGASSSNNEYKMGIFLNIKIANKEGYWIPEVYRFFKWLFI